MTESFTVVIATFNGEAVLPDTLASIARQKSIDAVAPLATEVLVIDGGSSDNSVQIALEFGARVIQNTLGHAISAKHIGFLQAKSNFICFLDQDESLMSEFSLARKLQIFRSYPNAVAALTSGYEVSKSESTANQYASEFGDPLNLFRYRTPNKNGSRLSAVERRFRSSKSINEDYLVFDLGTETRPTLLEVVATGGVIARKRVLDLDKIPLERDANSLPVLLSILPTVAFGMQAFILANDPIQHKSASTWKQVFAKVRWRVSNATEDAQGIGESGFRGRNRLEKTYATSFVINSLFSQLVFVFYVLSFLPIFIDSLCLAISRKRPLYLMNVALGYFVVYTAVTLMLKKIFRMGPKPRRYDGTSIS
jgi:glycosyltransferase involved in cell wall biosynthesis